jgi:L-cystine uptake protein TcyP (sodium:dicarboxylate symporter family)
MTTPMGVGPSIFLIAVGAILRFAVTARVSGIELATVGTILIVVGIVGLLLSLLWGMQAGRARTVGVPLARRRVVERERVVAPEPVVRERVVEPEPVVRERVVERDPYV